MRVFRLQPPYFRAIQAGKKTIEGRPYKPEYKALKIGEAIRFQNGDNIKKFIDVKIVSLKEYPTFREMLKKEGILRCLPDTRDLNDGEKVYYSFPRYREKERMWGVLAIGIDLNLTGEKHD